MYRRIFSQSVWREQNPKWAENDAHPDSFKEGYAKLNAKGPRVGYAVRFRFEAKWKPNFRFKEKQRGSFRFQAKQRITYAKRNERSKTKRKKRKKQSKIQYIFKQNEAKTAFVTEAKWKIRKRKTKRKENCGSKTKLIETYESETKIRKRHKNT